MKKVYLASGISDKPRKEYQRKMAEKIRSLGFEVYAASENDSINDKSNNPTPLDIYQGDIPKVLEADIFISCIFGGNEDGTNSEHGVFSGWNEGIEHIKWIIEMERLRLDSTNGTPDEYNILDEIESKIGDPIKVISYTVNERLLKPQFWSSKTIEAKLKRGEIVFDSEYLKALDSIINYMDNNDGEVLHPDLYNMLGEINRFLPSKLTEKDKFLIRTIQNGLVKDGVPSGGFNHLIAGMIDRWGEFVGGEEDMLRRLKDEL